MSESNLRIQPKKLLANSVEVIAAMVEEEKALLEIMNNRRNRKLVTLLWPNPLKEETNGSTSNSSAG